MAHGVGKRRAVLHMYAAGALQDDLHGEMHALGTAGVVEEVNADILGWKPQITDRYVPAPGP